MLEYLNQMREEQYDTLMEQVARQPRSISSSMLPPTPPLSPRLQELLDQVEFDEDEDEEDDAESDDSSDPDSEDEVLGQYWLGH